MECCKKKLKRRWKLCTNAVRTISREIMFNNTHLVRNVFHLLSPKFYEFASCTLLQTCAGKRQNYWLSLVTSNLKQKEKVNDND